MINKNIKKIIDELNIVFTTKYKHYLSYNYPYQLLIATILSAQSKDYYVNMITKKLFNKYKTIQKFANLNLNILQNDIKTIGLYHNKAKNIIKCSKMICEKYNYKIPSKMDELLKLPGVGRKTANVIRVDIFNIPSIIVDTHVKRVSRRLGFTSKMDAKKIEFDLMNILPKKYWITYSKQIIRFGKQICCSKKPRCIKCFLISYCIFDNKNI